MNKCSLHSKAIIKFLLIIDGIEKLIEFEVVAFSLEILGDLQRPWYPISKLTGHDLPIMNFRQLFKKKKI